MIGKKCLKSLLVLGGIVSVFAFGKTALASEEVPVVKGEDGKYDISCIVQAPEGSKWINHYFTKVPFEVTSVDEKNPKASVESIVIPDADDMEKGGAKFDSVKKVWTAKFSTRISFEKFEHTGIYVYKLKEGSLHAGTKATAPSTEYTVRVFVVDNGKGPVIKGVTAEESGLKRSVLSFVNDAFPEASFYVKQEVSGDLADKTKSFEYVVKVEKPAFVGKKHAESVTLRKGMKGVEVPYGKDYTFEMKSSEKVILYIPVGAHAYLYKKCKKDGYIPKHSAYKDFADNRHSERIGKDGEYIFSLLGDSDGKASPNEVLVADREIGVTVTDVASNDVPLTGLFLDEKSGVMMVAVALGSLVALGAGAVIYKKKTSDR